MARDSESVRWGGRSSTRVRADLPAGRARTGSDWLGCRNKITSTSKCCARNSSTEAERSAPPPIGGYGASGDRNSALSLPAEAPNGFDIHLVRLGRRSFPGEFRGAKQTPCLPFLPPTRLVDRDFERFCPGFRIPWIDQPGSVSGYFRNSRAVRGDYRSSALHF